ncbi:MAG: VOC family protein, partial [Pseudomonadota bacterium]
AWTDQVEQGGNDCAVAGWSMTSELGTAAPFLIVSNVEDAVTFYQNRLGFSVTALAPEKDPFFAIVERGQAMILLKTVEAAPLPNPTRDSSARWDIYVTAPDPDALASEFKGNGVRFTKPLRNSHDGLRGFEIRDVDGYVLFFGRPR